MVLPMKAMKDMKAMKATRAMKAMKKTEIVWRCMKKTWPTDDHRGEWLADIQWKRQAGEVVETWMVPVRIPFRRRRPTTVWWRSDPKAAKKATKAMKAMKATGAKERQETRDNKRMTREDGRGARGERREPSGK